MVDLPRPVAPEDGKKKKQKKIGDCEQLSDPFLKIPHVTCTEFLAVITVLKYTVHCTVEPQYRYM